MYPWRMYIDVGRLIAYGLSPREYCPRSTVFVDKILQGAKHSNPPIKWPNF